ncbi:hypothetical protein AB0333_06470 [Citricoccus sp. NPDC079358]|jgi:hypothetical protein|uniref:Membrane protein n=1 Tax=Paenarthrobacter aurescens (strain TC1) TaxID=290340 RepID=A1R4J3_PAEAT|nr:hypothetical protein [Paenarthrobacter aurescens]ABM06609.1 putative membrane protein [Paenarthrobacter aurescens TC1]MDP9989135.1 hypothetical protein [Arthrobacter oryzae]
MVSVYNYFRKHQRYGSNWWIKAAPVVGRLGVLCVVILMIQYLGTTVGQTSESLLFKLIPYIAAALFLAGTGFALYLK